MAALCSTVLNELVMVQAITEWTQCLEEAEMSLDVVRARWERDRKDGERKEPREAIETATEKAEERGMNGGDQEGIES